jgi:hypothetical protein
MINYVSAHQILKETTSANINFPLRHDNVQAIWQLQYLSAVSNI